MIRSGVLKILSIFRHRILFPATSFLAWINGYSLAFMGSVYGVARLSTVSARNSKIIHDAHQGLLGKQLLILGTGPSASSISADYVKCFDHVILLNHAVSMVPYLLNIGFAKHQISFFCADRKRIIEVTSALKTANLPLSNSIFFPDFPYSVFFFDLSVVPALLIGGWKKWNAKYIGPFAQQGWQLSFNEIPMLKKDVKASFDRFMSGGPLRPPYIPYTVAFSCILFFSLYRPRTVRLLGCDFSGDFQVYPVNKTFDLIASWLGDYGIQLCNDSRS
jgi:hypothetical protein